MLKSKTNNNSISEQLKALEQYNPDDLIKIVKGLPLEIQAALVVRLADGTTMFGKTFYDQVSTDARNGETRYTVQVHPYPWAAAGASNVIIYRNQFGSLSVKYLLF